MSAPHSPAPPTASGAAKSGRRLRQRVAVISRWLHIYASMLGLAAVLFFSLTGLTLNHPDWLLGSRQRQEEFRGQIPVEWLGGDNAPVRQLEIVELLRKEHGLRGAVEEFREEDEELSVSFKGAGCSADAFIKRPAGTYELTVISEGWVAVVNDLHKGRHTGKTWSVVIDVCAVVLTLISATGLALLFFVRRRRIPGLIVAAVGTAVIVLAAWLLIP